MKRLREENIELNNVITTTTTNPIDMTKVKSYSIQAVYDVDVPNNLDFATSDVDASSDEITETGHGLTTGLKVQVSTTDTLPAGLSASTDYFVIVVDADTYQLASSLANALAGTQIDITDQGVGTHTLEPQAVAGGVVKIQKSNNYNAALESGDWVDEGSSVNITADGSSFFEKADPSYRWVRVHVTCTSGRIQLDNHILLIGEE